MTMKLRPLVEGEESTAIFLRPETPDRLRAVIEFEVVANGCRLGSYRLQRGEQTYYVHVDAIREWADGTLVAHGTIEASLPRGLEYVGNDEFDRPEILYMPDEPQLEDAFFLSDYLFPL